MFSWLGVIAGLYIISRAKQDLGAIRGLLPGEAGCAVTGHAMFVSRVWALNPGSGTSPRFMKVFTAKRLNRLAQCFSPIRVNEVPRSNRHAARWTLSRRPSPHRYAKRCGRGLKDSARGFNPGEYIHTATRPAGAEDSCDRRFVWSTSANVRHRFLPPLQHRQPARRVQFAPGTLFVGAASLWVC